jgi:hypothetical protein
LFKRRVIKTNLMDALKKKTRTLTAIQFDGYISNLSEILSKLCKLSSEMLNTFVEVDEISMPRGGRLKD